LIKKAILYSNTLIKETGGGTTYLHSFIDFFRNRNFSIDCINNEIIRNTNGINHKKHPSLIIPVLYPLYRMIYDFLVYDVVLFKSNYIPGMCINSKSILIVDFPFQTQLSIFDKYKIRRIKYVLCNSEYTAKWIHNYWGVNAKVIYPPSMKTDTVTHEIIKRHTILSVGRFVNSSRGKRQDILINSFKTLCDSGIINYTLQLVGYVQDENYLMELKKQSEGYPIEFIENIDSQTLKKLYQEATFYWHACGYDIDSNTDPSKVEHYGIAVADAIAFGCFPLVYGNGGPAELTNQGIYGEIWFSEVELTEKTIKYINDPALLNNARQLLEERKLLFTEAAFIESLSKIYGK
jgi:glycosyltransferase involved in cell wall biosynthesis